MVIVVIAAVSVAMHVYKQMARVTQKRKPFQFRLDLHSGVPVYRQIIAQVIAGIASGALATGHQLPTVRQLAVDLAINPNTVIRAYREFEFAACWKRSRARELSSAIGSRSRTVFNGAAASITLLVSS